MEVQCRELWQPYGLNQYIEVQFAIQGGGSGAACGHCCQAFEVGGNGGGHVLEMEGVMTSNRRQGDHSWDICKGDSGVER